MAFCCASLAQNGRGRLAQGAAGSAGWAGPALLSRGHARAGRDADRGSKEDASSTSRSETPSESAHRSLQKASGAPGTIDRRPASMGTSTSALRACPSAGACYEGVGAVNCQKAPRAPRCRPTGLQWRFTKCCSLPDPAVHHPPLLIGARLLGNLMAGQQRRRAAAGQENRAGGEQQDKLSSNSLSLFFCSPP